MIFLNFDEALKIELETIPEFLKKAFPLVAPLKTNPAFCVYQKVSIEWKKTLSGTLNKATGVYNITVLASNYTQLQEMAELTANKLMSFFQRRIGSASEGPYIENVTVKNTGDRYETENDLYRSDLQLTVNY